MSYLAPLSESQRETASDLPHDDIIEDLSAPTHNASHLDEGVRVLKALWPLMQVELTTPTMRAEFGCLSPDPVLKVICFSLQGIFQNSEDKPPEDKILRKLAASISDNTAKRLKLPGQKSMTEYAYTFTGNDLRWEALGMLFARFALRASPLGTSGIFVADRNHHNHWSMLIEATNSCLSLCDDLGSMNDLTFWTMDENYMALTLFHGDSGSFPVLTDGSKQLHTDLAIGYMPWKRLGDLSSALFALGLHLDVACTPEVPRWLVEIRKHSMLHAFWCDKTMSCFVGRPPRINGRYCAMQKPFALSYEELALPPAELEEVVAKLGPDPHRFTSLQEFPAAVTNSHLLMQHREQILELFLYRQVSADEAEACLAEVSAASAREWRDRPEEFRYHEDVWDRGLSIHVCYVMLILHLDHLYNDFLIERYRVQRLHAPPEELLRLSTQLLADGLIVIAMRDKHGSGFTDIPWMLVSSINALLVRRRETKLLYRHFTAYHQLACLL